MRENKTLEKKAESAYSVKEQPGKVLDTANTDSIIKDPSAVDTIKSILKHKKSVADKLNFLAKELLNRAEHHDDSKLVQPEIGWLIEMDKEPKASYGSDEYFGRLQRWQKFFDHHYAVNRHHPDHFKDLGVQGFNLADLCEYLMDICSYFDKMHVSDAIKVVEEQSKRFGLDEQLSQILKNTLIEYYSWIGDEIAPAYQEP